MPSNRPGSRVIPLAMPETPLAGRRFTTTILASISPKSESVSEMFTPESESLARSDSKGEAASEYTVNEENTGAGEAVSPQKNKLSSGQMTIGQWSRLVHSTMRPATVVQVVTRTKKNDLVREDWSLQQVMDHLSRGSAAFPLFANVFSDWIPPEAELIMDDPSFDWVAWNYCETRWPGWSGYRMVANKNAVSGLHFSLFHQLVWIEDGGGNIRQYHYDTDFLLHRRSNLDVPLSTCADFVSNKPFTDLVFQEGNWSYIPPGCLYSFLSTTWLLMSVRNIPLKSGAQPRSVMKKMLRNLPIKDPITFLYGPRGPLGLNAEAEYRDVPFSPHAAIPVTVQPEQPYELPSHPASAVASLGVPTKPTHEPARRPIKLEYVEPKSAITGTAFPPPWKHEVEREEDGEPEPDWDEALWQMTEHERWIT